MANGGGLKWEENSVYTEQQVLAVLKALGVSVETETEAVFLAYCPFHGNRDTPSFAVSKTEGLFICYNPACDRMGNLMQLITSASDMDEFDAKRLIARSRRKGDIQKQLEKMVEPQETFAPYVDSDIPNYGGVVKADFWKHDRPQMYIKGRGFERATAEKFELGYDKELDMVCVPMHDPMGKNEVGFVRRSVEGKTFKNTPGLPTSKTLFNLHRAKRTGDVIILVEASFSAMRLDQVGYPNAAALLMGHFSNEHASLLNKYFNRIIIMTDYDKRQFYPACGKCKKAGSKLCKGHNPGEELGAKIADAMSNKDVLWAHCGEAKRFPDGMKDPDDMDDELIRYCIKNAVSNFEYSLDL